MASPLGLESVSHKDEAGQQRQPQPLFLSSSRKSWNGKARKGSLLYQAVTCCPSAMFSHHVLMAFFSPSHYALSPVLKSFITQLPTDDITLHRTPQLAPGHRVTICPGDECVCWGYLRAWVLFTVSTQSSCPPALPLLGCAGDGVRWISSRKCWPSVR